MKLKQLSASDIKDKRVLIRFDGDVPVEDGKIQDTNRLESALATIRYCLEHGAKVLLLCSMGRPKESAPDPSLSTEQLVPFFEKALGEKVGFSANHDFGGFGTKHFPDERIVILENLRFDPGEEKNDPLFSKKIASAADVYVNEAIAVSHRAHASFVGIPALLPHYAGLHLVEEVEAMTPLLDGADKPYAVVLGGSKASDKSPIIADLIDKVDYLLIGGLVAVTYLAAMGQDVGAHKVDEKEVALARKCIKEMHEEGVEFIVPEDIVTQDRKVKTLAEWGKDDLMLDVGPATQAAFAKVIEKANTLFWNGAMGKFEDAAFAGGTHAVARAMAHADAEVRIAAGGDTVSAIHKFKLEKGFTFISTGGGATLEFIAGRKLPGLEALK